MKSLDEVMEALRRIPHEQWIFVSGEEGVVELQEKLSPKTSHGIFLRFLLDDVVYSGVIQTSSQSNTRKAFLEIPTIMQEKNATILRILRLPLNRISLFPLFTVIDMIPKGSVEGIGRNFWAEFTKEVDALESWFLDYLRYKREIVYEEIPELEPAMPHWLQNLEVFVLYDKAKNAIATRYYRSDNEDAISVKETKQLTMKNREELFSKLFDLPSTEKYFYGNFVSSVGEKPVYSGWGHPYFAAVENLKERVKSYNGSQPRCIYSAYDTSEVLLKNWAFKEIEKIRELATEFPELKKVFRQWLKGVQVLILYFIHKPKRGWITDGILSSYYVNGPSDRIVVKRVEDKDKTKYDEEMMREYMPESSLKPFYWRQSSILHFLRDVFGQK